MEIFPRELSTISLSKRGIITTKRMGKVTNKWGAASQAISKRRFRLVERNRFLHGSGMSMKLAGMTCGMALLSAGLMSSVWAADTNSAATVLNPNVDGDFVIGSDYTNAPEMTAREGVPKGTVHDFVMESTDSKIYPGIAKDHPGVTVPYERKVAVYIPHQYVPGTSAPFIIIQDGIDMHYREWMPVALDNMIADHKLPVMIAIMINSGGGDAQGSERGLEYDTVSDRYVNFVEMEVLPKIARDYNVKFTTDPDGRATMGGSSGASCAFTMAWFRPDLYHRVLSYSGTFVNQQSPLNPESPHGAWEYHEHILPKADPKPLRIWLEVGENDLGYQRDEASLHNWPMANERMAAILKAKGYHYQYVFCKGAKHIDSRAIGETLPEALLWLWQGYLIK